MINVDMICNILECYKEEYHTGPMPIKISLAGNHEPEQKEIQDVLEKEAFDCGFIIRDINILHDDDAGKGFTRVTANVLDSDTLLDYIRELENKSTTMSKQILSSALNKAITMLDDYNNMYGDVMPKTQEISDLDEILKLHS